MNVWNWNAVDLKMKKLIAGKFGIHEKSGQCVKCQFEHARHLSKSLVYSGGYYASLFARVRKYTWFEPGNCSLGANFQLGELLETRPKGERKSWKIEENMENVERDQILLRKTISSSFTKCRHDTLSQFRQREMQKFVLSIFFAKKGDKIIKVSLCLTLCPLRWLLEAFFRWNKNHMVSSHPFFSTDFSDWRIFVLAKAFQSEILSEIIIPASTAPDLAHSNDESSSLILFQNALSCVFLDRFTTYWYLFSLLGRSLLASSYWLVYMHSVGWQFDPWYARGLPTTTRPSSQEVRLSQSY